MAESIIGEIQGKMEKTVSGLSTQLLTIRTGRASPALIENIQVEYHEVMTPIQQIASIVVSESNLLVIRPWERGSIREIEKAILKADIGLNPSNDGTVVRVIIPHLSAERRVELAKLVSKRVEERHITLRNERRAAVAKLREQEKNKEISQDQMVHYTKVIDSLCAGFIDQVDKIGLDKEKEIKEL